MHKTVMVVEDDEAIGYLLMHALQDELHCRVVLVTDGMQALKMAEQVAPNLFLLDYLLPSLNGLELYRQLNSQDKLASTPKIIMSANLPPLREEQGHILTLKKPFEIEDLLGLVSNLLAPEPA